MFFDTLNTVFLPLNNVYIFGSPILTHYSYVEASFVFLKCERLKINSYSSAFFDILVRSWYLYYINSMVTTVESFVRMGRKPLAILWGVLWYLNHPLHNLASNWIVLSHILCSYQNIYIYVLYIYFNVVFITYII